MTDHEENAYYMKANADWNDMENPNAQSYEPDAEYLAALEDYECYKQEMVARTDNLVAECDAAAPLIKHLQNMDAKHRQILYWQLADMDPEAIGTVFWMEPETHSNELVDTIQKALALVADDVTVHIKAPEKRRNFYSYIFQWREGSLRIPHQINPMSTA
jgi:hypothetical protein